MTKRLDDQDATWHRGRPQPRSDCVRWGLSSPSPKGVPQPHFSTHIYCSQTAGWIKMALGMEVGLGPGHIVLDGDSAPLQFFGLCLLWPNGCVHQDTTWNGGRPRPRRHCVSTHRRKKTGTAHNFRSTSVVAKRSPISDAAELLYQYLMTNEYSYFTIAFSIWGLSRNIPLT